MSESLIFVFFKVLFILVLILFDVEKLKAPPMYSNTTFFKPRILGDLVKILSESPIPITYAGGVRCLNDLELIDKLGRGCVNATIGSALGEI